MTEYEALFKDLVRRINRPGFDEFLEWLDATDFYKSPASTNHHDSESGGLLKHSVNVTNIMLTFQYKLPYKPPIESIIICGLFHDICKAQSYKPIKKWRKDSNDNWEQYETYVFDEELKYGGHGSKSVFLLQKYMDLSVQEATAIHAHMGAWDATKYSNPGSVYGWNPLAWLLHISDEFDTYSKGW